MLGFLAGLEAQVQFNAPRGVEARAQRAPFGCRAKEQSGQFVIGHSTQFAMHQGAEKRIHEVQNTLPASKVVHQRYNLAAAMAPLLYITLKNVRISLAKAVNAL